MDSFPNFSHLNSQDHITSFYISSPSEPPDVGNWFSSYEYKSPLPDSNLNFQDSAFQTNKTESEGKIEKKEVNASFEDDKNNEEPKHVVDTFSSHSPLLSEPPDIRNWFSSYVYESPMTGTSSHFEDFVSSVENGCEEMNVIVGEKYEHNVSSENVDKGESLRHNSFSHTSTRANQLSSRDDGSIEMKEHISSASTSHLEKVLQPCKRQDRPSQHNVNTTNCEDSKRSKREHTLTLNLDKKCTRPPYLVVHKTDMKEAPSKEIIQHGNRSPNATAPAKALSEWKSTRSSEKENVGMRSMNGFVTTKKRGCETREENYGKRTQEKSSPGVINGRRDSTAGNKEGTGKRKALAEVTNVEICSEMEITGKWKCLRKGKPYVGPPLKQLRLEQWVHRN